MLKNIIRILSIPLLYYSEKSEISVFRNYCLFKDTGCKYNMEIPKANVGKALEFRFELDKYLKWVYVLTPIILYLIFIHFKFSIGKLLFFEFLWLGIVNGCRIACSYIYSKYLIKTFGKYEVCLFKPPVSKQKIYEYVSLFRSKVIAIVILIGLFFLPALFIPGIVKFELKHNKFNAAIKTSNLYFTFYPKKEKIYDMRAYAKFRLKDFEGSLADYKAVIEISGKNFKDNDFTRFANLLLLQKRTTSPTEAVDVFNEYLTTKKLSVLNLSKMLWIKSIFRVENNITEGILQEYDDLLMSLDEDDTQNRFYIMSDKAYISYIMREYVSALQIYNEIIPYAQQNKDKYEKELKALHVERGFAKQSLGDLSGAQADFILSGVKADDIPQFEPYYNNQEFMLDLF